MTHPLPSPEVPGPRHISGLGEFRVGTYKSHPIQHWDRGCYSIQVPEDNAEPLGLVYDGQHPSIIGAMEWKQMYGAVMGARLWMAARLPLRLEVVSP